MKGHGDEKPWARLSALASFRRAHARKDKAKRGRRSLAAPRPPGGSGPSRRCMQATLPLRKETCQRYAAGAKVTQRHRDSRTEECGFKRRGDAPRCSGRLSPPWPGLSKSRSKARAETALAPSLVAGARAETRRTRARANALRAESRHAAAQARNRRCPDTNAKAASLAAAGCASLTLLATRAHRGER
jgi:hypothetical protein